ncbi:MAG: glycerol kinase GlpK [Pseudomonadota bacterium]
MKDHILVIDEGTTSTRAIVFDREFKQVAISQQEVALQYPDDGWVEQDGEEIWAKTLEVCHNVISMIGGADSIAAIGIANQRETTLIWNRETLKPIAPAIVWQDRRTASVCDQLKKAGHEEQVVETTGLLLDPYFSGTKAAWLLDNVPGSRVKAEAGELAFGTIETFLIAKLTGGEMHASDATNASRTLMARLGCNEDGGWDQAMLDLLNVPRSVLPEIRSCKGRFGETDSSLFGRSIPILSAIGDQQAALVGQGCLSPGQAKVTYGTGAFLVVNTGDVRPNSAHRLLGTIGVNFGDTGCFALEGSIFNAGTVIKWLRDELVLIANAAESEAQAASLPDSDGVYFVPAFTGLGAPHWDADARGQISGLTRGTRTAHIVRAGLESAAYQTLELLEAFSADGAPVSQLRIDGGMAANDWLMQFIADICDVTVDRPDYMEMTALGAAALAGMELDWITPDGWGRREGAFTRFEPKMDQAERQRLIAGWKQAVRSVLASGARA